VLAPADISDEDAVDSLFAGVVQAFGGLDVLVNNAGIKAFDEPHEAHIADFDRVMGVNLRGAFLCAQAAIQHFIDVGQPGVIVSTSSIHEVVPMPEAIAYQMSKAGLGGMTRSLALRYARDGIRIVAVGPGAVQTPMNPEFDDPQKLMRVEQRDPDGAHGAAGGNRRGHRVPCLRRGVLHHRADGLRRRRLDDQPAALSAAVPFAPRQRWRSSTRSIMSVGSRRFSQAPTSVGMVTR
jgi:NAD(P)-dependent dehydrogenase (short-subunit alcohol dehydrogenase family)